MVEALLLGLVAFIAQSEYALGTSLISRPIVTGLLTGLVLGDVQTGVIMGATLELAFIGSFSVGASIPPDVVTGGILGVAFAITSGAGTETALLLGLPIATLTLILKNIYLGMFIPMLSQKADGYAERADLRGIERMHLIAGFGLSLMLAAVVTVSFLVGSNAVKSLLDTIPEVIVRTSRFIGRHSETLRSGERFVATGYGALVGVAKEFETKFSETVRVPSSGFELEAYMHGPYLEANARHVMLFIEDTPDARTRALRDYLAPSIGRAFTLTLGDEEDAQTLALNCPCEHHLAPLLLIVPVQMLAWHTAGLKGIDLAKRIFDDFDRVLKSKI
ncbi:hypothetical protein DV720_15445 [Klebsiella pneumoniae]|nr:hypothetical protein [Klebsiella pneumoniae]